MGHDDELADRVRVALHGLDDVAALSGSAQRGVEAVRQVNND